MVRKHLEPASFMLRGLKSLTCTLETAKRTFVSCSTVPVATSKSMVIPLLSSFDEAEAVLSERGTQRSSDVDKTIVPMFLSEMDGLVENNCLVILATNRPKMLDPAVVREGRVDRHIMIPRPDN